MVGRWALIAGSLSDDKGGRDTEWSGGLEEEFCAGRNPNIAHTGRGRCVDECEG
jgi:hypothetical protein